MRSGSWFVGALLALTGCAAGERGVEDAGADLPELPAEGVVAPPTLPGAGGAGGMGGVGGMGGMGVGGMGGGLPPQDMMPPPDMPVGGQAGCTPGQRLGVCSVCNNDGMPSNPGLDAECPVDCAGFAYEQVPGEGGVVRCVLSERARVVDDVVCLDVGVCETDPAILCGQPNTQQFAEAMPCQLMEGCVGEEPPQVMQAPNGTACGDEGEGTCNNGVCEIDDPCAINNPFAGEFCGQGDDNGNPWCEWYVDGPGNNDYSCHDFCSSIGMFCLAVWNNVRVGCGHGDGWNCNERADDQICRCTY